MRTLAHFRNTWPLAAGGILFYLLFYRQAMGINVLLYGAALLVMAWFSHPHLRIKEGAQLAAFAFVISLIAFTVWDSDMAYATCLMALLVFLGSLYESPLHSVGAAFNRSFHKLFKQAPIYTLQWLKALTAPVAKKLRLRWSLAGYLLVLPVLLVFLSLLQGSSPVFAHWVNTSARWFISLLNWHWVGQLIMFMIVGGLGVWLSSAVLAPARPERLLPWEKTQALGTPFLLGQAQGEGRIYGALLLGINLLLAIYNVIDIEWIWFNFQMPKGVPMSQLVHQGTYFLIVSILLSSGLLLIIFRNNRQSYSRATLVLAQAWLAQNMLLAMSVVIRNYRYIDTYGLAYKRIGVIFFLVLTLIGIVTLRRKIVSQLTLGHLFRLNSFAVAALWLMAACVDWDGLILQYNLAKIKPGAFDSGFHVDLSIHQLPTVIQHMETIAPGYIDTRIMKYRLEEFKREFEQAGWPSKTPRDYSTYKALCAWEYKLKEVEPYEPQYF